MVEQPARKEAHTLKKDEEINGDNKYDFSYKSYQGLKNKHVMPENGKIFVT